MKKYGITNYIANGYQIEPDILKQTKGIEAEYSRDDQKRPYVFYEETDEALLQEVLDYWRENNLDTDYHFVPNYSSFQFDGRKRVYMTVEQTSVCNEIDVVAVLLEEEKSLKEAHVFYRFQTKSVNKDWSSEVCQLLEENEMVVTCTSFDNETELLQLLSQSLEAYRFAPCLTEYAFPFTWNIVTKKLADLKLQLVDVYNFIDRDFVASQTAIPTWKENPFIPLLRLYAAIPPVFSYHTFVLPITIDNLNLDKLQPSGWNRRLIKNTRSAKLEMYEQLQSIYHEGHGYTINEKPPLKEKLLKQSFEEACEFSSLVETKEHDKNFNQYNLYRFFYNSVLDCLKDATYYTFEKSKKYLEIESYPEQYRSGTKLYLEVNDIKFRLHDCIDQNSWAGFLIISLSNRFYADILTIEKINQIGRRVYPPYINPKVTLMESARDMKFVDDFSNNRDVQAEKDKKSADENMRQELLNHRLMSAITELLESLFGKESDHVEIIKRWEDKSDHGTPLVVDDIADDRMFTITHYSINDNEQIFRTYSQTNENFEVNKLLYQFCCIDNGSSSCQSPRRIKPLLEEKLYEQWIEENTVYGITQHSMLMFTTPEVPNYLYVYFYTLYFEMILFTLLQRVFIVHYIAEAGKLSESFKSGKILTLQRNYVRFKNRYLLPEVTPQAHPIELYTMMQERLGVTKQQEVLEEQMALLFETNNNIRSDQLNTILFGFTIISLISIYTDFSGLLSGIPIFSNHYYLIPFCIMVIFFLFLIGFVFRTGIKKYLKVLRNTPKNKR